MRSLIVCSLVAASSALLPASIIVSVEAPGVQSTTTPGAVTQDFNSFAAGPFAGGATNVGTYSAGGEIVNPNAFGGSNATKVYFRRSAERHNLVQSHVQWATGLFRILLAGNRCLELGGFL